MARTRRARKVGPTFTTRTQTWRVPPMTISIGRDTVTFTQVVVTDLEEASPGSLAVRYQTTVQAEVAGQAIELAGNVQARVLDLIDS